MIEQGDIWWVEEPESKPRPALVVTRNSAIPLLTSVTVAPLTRNCRDIPTEVALGPADGIAVDCVASFDNLRTISRSRLTGRAGRLAVGRWHEVCEATRIAIGC